MVKLPQGKRRSFMRFTHSYTTLSRDSDTGRILTLVLFAELESEFLEAVPVALSRAVAGRPSFWQFSFAAQTNWRVFFY